MVSNLNEQSHLCTSLQRVSTSWRFICIVGLKVLSFSLYIMAVLLVCSFCANGYLCSMCIVCHSSFISSGFSVFTAFLSLDWFLYRMFANRGGENIKYVFINTQNNMETKCWGKKQIHSKLQFQQLKNNDIKRNKIKSKWFQHKTVLIW